MIMYLSLSVLLPLSFLSWEGATVNMSCITVCVSMCVCVCPVLCVVWEGASGALRELPGRPGGGGRRVLLRQPATAPRDLGLLQPLRTVARRGVVCSE